MSNDTLIKNARIINENRQFEADVRIHDGRITNIGPDLSAAAGALIVDANGKYLLPGMIDDQVHFREPGLTHKGDIQTESSAAVAGGITSFMDMPNTRPQAIDLETLEEKYARAEQVSLANYSFYLGASNDNLEQIKRLDPARICGLKIFMGASTGNMLVDDESVLRAIFKHAPCLITTHCESSPQIDRNLELARQQYGNDIPLSEHPNIRSREACYESSRLAVELATTYAAQLHILHLSTADELALFAPGPVVGKNITAEVCVHFLHFDATDYATYGNFIKCNPAIKNPADRTALINALNDDRLDIIATDHAPHTLEEKENPDYMAAPAGLPLVQFALPAVLELVEQGRLRIEQVVEKTAHNVARRFCIQERGFIREGYWADLVLVDDDNPPPVTREQVLSRCGWSPFEGWHFKWRIDTTFVSGQIAYQAGRPDPSARGTRLKFVR